MIKQNAINLRTKARTNDLQHPTTLKRKIGYCDDSEDEDMPEIGRMKVDHQVV
jgi:hypothetical protein